MPFNIDPEKERLIRANLLEGKTYNQIREFIKVSPQTILKIKRDLQRPRAEVNQPLLTLQTAQEYLNRIATMNPPTVLSLQALKEYISCLKSKTFENPDDAPTLEQKIAMMKNLLSNVDIIELVKSKEPGDLDTIADVLSDISRARKTKPKTPPYDGSALIDAVQKEIAETAHE